MGIVKVSDDIHEQVRVASKAMSRSINAQAEHWLRVGRILEQNPEFTYAEVCRHLYDQARSEEVEPTDVPRAV